MTILGLCFDTSAHGAAHSHDPILAVLSFVVAAFASYCSLDMAERLRAAGPRGRPFWLAMSGLTLGAGIWAMHFIAMTAFKAPFEQGYDAGLTLASGLAAIGAVICGLAALGRKPTMLRLIASGVIVGLGVVVMHYSGMAALRAPVQIVYRPGIFSLSVLIALTAATAALWLAFNVEKVWHRIAAAGVMAIAICGMHYTAMLGTEMIVSPLAGAGGQVVSKGLLAAVVAVGVAGLIAVGLMMAFLDRRKEAQAFQEASRLRALNVELEAARAEAENAAEAKARFLATMSHEIRTPMNGVLGMLEVALRSNLDATQRDHITTARDSAASLLHILNDILDYSKIEAGQLTLEKVSFSVHQLLDEVVSMFAAQASGKSILLEAAIDETAPKWIVGDPTRMRQVMLNLVGNALKFTRQGGVAIRIGYSGSPADGRVRIEVRDTGVGISEEARQKLFTRFTQADASTTRRFGGTGLGLAICRDLIVRMDGEIGVDSELGKGSTFWFSLPTSAGEACEPTVIEALAAQAPQASLNILVAEDNPINQKVLRALMAGQGHELCFVNDGAQAVEAAAEGGFDLILMDVSMPVMDGPAAARAIRALAGEIGSIPIIALTANAMAGDREAYLAAGMSDYVSKPIALDDLLAAIARQARLPGEMPAPQAPKVEAGAAVDAAAPLNAGLDDLLASLGLDSPKAARKGEAA